MALEEKEIKGLTVKNAYWFLGSIGSIIFTVLVTYFSIVARIDKIEILKKEFEKYNDLRIMIVENKLSSLESQLRSINEKYETILTEVKKINK